MKGIVLLTLLISSVICSSQDTTKLILVNELLHYNCILHNENNLVEIILVDYKLQIPEVPDSIWNFINAKYSNRDKGELRNKITRIYLDKNSVSELKDEIRKVKQTREQPVAPSEILNFQEIRLVFESTLSLLTDSISNELRLLGYFGSELTDEKCAEFKQGKFVIRLQGGEDVHIVKDGNRQVEKHEGRTSIYELEYINGCDYKLILIESDDPMMRENSVFIIEPFEILGTSIRFKCRLDNENGMTIIGEMIKLK